ncbi:DUF1775 domain-containing protein [Microbacterium ulmi]|uniref:DUF1775 domain-containing protein n=1 Tax=Microbacterium ulmi TaxID=179095 RepID=A0A7Y2M2A1_9MICO|nr:DUF1775 domain-containing protein [Microbacterium ulmi]NII70518.1 uncharacterized protein YcnI [Microbacterium ulmi]NNH05196.1 DUF1775 domain-containing protein [Microbacterium ulmi]
MPRTTSLPRRGAALVSAGAAAGAVLAFVAPLAASAHIHVGPDAIPAGTTSTLTFTFQHGCDDSPTTALVFDVPDAVAVATPIVQGGWTIARELGDDGLPARITFTADSPIESGLKASVAMDVLFAADAANTVVAFPVTQECAAGETAWTEVAAEGEDPGSLDDPAPLVTVRAAADEPAGHGHGAAGEAEADSSGESSSSVGDPVARGLAGAGLVAAVAALLGGLLRRRPARR